ncbi:hypothetical protein HA402_013828 [Bradysia odoriphaga]|nr:hypothetical protein HA402_013828 [Bradysia odoriphaga]
MDAVLNGSLATVLGMQDQRPNVTVDNVKLQKVGRMSRKLDNFGSNRFFYVQTRNADGFDDKQLNDHYYINYQQAYGIRFDPRKIKRSFSFKESANDESVTTETFDDTTTISSDFQEDNDNEDAYDAEEGLLSTPFLNDTKWPAVTNETSNFVDDSHVYDGQPSNENVNSYQHVAQPSRIATALQHLNTKIKNLFSIDVSANPSTQRFLNVFNIIKFENVPCTSSKPPLTPLDGTCYHKFECDQRGGIAVDTCAGGYGVCCVFQFGCGGTTNQNVSYFKNPDFPAATKTKLICTFTVELQPSVNQVFIEFLFFELKAPKGGSCVDDQFIVAGHSSNNLIPILCGVNSGQHVYVNVDSSLDRKLYLSVLAASPDARAFNIRISQIQGAFGQAPQNCLQYYQDANGVVQTFNYDDLAEIVEVRNPTYFNNLNYAICIKRLPEFCTIQYTNIIGKFELPFQLVNVDLDGTSVIPSGQAGAEIYNCADDFISVNGIRLCGDKLNDGSVTDDFTISAPVADYSAGPIIIPVRTNDAVVGRGFKLIYQQLPCQDVTE